MLSPFAMRAARAKAVSHTVLQQNLSRPFQRHLLITNKMYLRRRLQVSRLYHESSRVLRPSSSPFVKEFRTQMKQRPVALSLTMFVVFLVGPVGLSWAFYQWWQVYKEYQAYPDSVSTKLRRAIHFTKDEFFDAPQAFKAYVAALRLAEEEGMDALSDEIFVIQWRLCDLCEKTGNIQEAIQILENLKNNCLTWINETEQNDENAGRRARLLSRACDASTRKGELYTDKLVGDEKKSEESLVWAVETAMKERRRRVRDGLRPGEEDWFSEEQHETQLEALGHFYEEQGRHYYAAQLFLKALTMKSKRDCHSVVLMNNVAASLSQQAPPVEPGTPSASSTELRESGRSWANQALALARKIEPPERNEECDRGCAVATHNLGEFAEMEGNLKEAREKYEEAASLAHAIGFEEGVKAADEGVKRITKGRSQTKRKSSWW